MSSLKPPEPAERPVVLYEDARILALDKPCGQSVIPDRAGGIDPGALVEAAGRHVGAKVFVVHRLDRATSGAVLFAKDADAHRELCSLFESRRVHKVYLALVRGRVESEGVVDAPLRIFGSGRVGVSPEGKPSVTRYSVERAFQDATLLKVEPVTGRRHQIRAHLFSIGHPVLGDKRYGKERRTDIPRLMLHAQDIAFNLEGLEIRVSAPLPPDFLDVLARFPS